MSEMAQTADHIIVLGRGRVLADAPVGDFLAGDRERVRVRVSDPAQLGVLLAAEGVTIAHAAGDTLEIEGIPAAHITRAAVGAGIDVHELTPLRASLEEAYLALTGDAVEYRSDPAAVAA
jgi:ABC-2 type transport system ATP-binding protein